MAQVIFKTRYDQDMDFLVDRGERFRVLLLLAVACAAPVFVSDYYLSELALFFVYALAGIGLMVLVGFSGQVSFGHAAFLGIGAYSHSYFLTLGLPFLASLPVAALFSGLIGAALGRATSKMHGFYLAIATLAFVIVVETIIGEDIVAKLLVVFNTGEGDELVITGGHMGLQVPEIDIFGYAISGMSQYYLYLLVLVFFVWGVANLMRSPSGRSMIAVRDSETSARSLGLNVARTKLLAFFVSAFITGAAGALMAHLLFYLSPETFGVQESLKLLLMVIVGGLGTISGAILGAVFVSFLPNIIGVLRTVLPDNIADAAGLEQFLFGAIIAAFIIFEPDGIYGRWRKFRLFLETFPFYKKATFVRQKRYLKTERFR